MSKVKSLLGTSQSQPAQTQASDFMQSLVELAQPYEKPHQPADPLERMRGKFIANADAAIKALQDGTDKTKWFRKLPDGKVVVAFRNANSPLSINGSTHFQVTDVAAAVKLIDAAKAAVTQGEFDAALMATQRKPPVRAKKDVGTPA